MMGYNSMATYDGGVWWRDYDEFETELEVHLNKDGNQAVRQPWLSAASWRRRPCWRRCSAGGAVARVTGIAARRPRRDI